MARGEFEWRAGVAGRGEERGVIKSEGRRSKAETGGARRVLEATAKYAEYAEKGKTHVFPNNSAYFEYSAAQKNDGNLRHRQSVRSPTVPNELSKICPGCHLNTPIREQHLAGFLVQFMRPTHNAVSCESEDSVPGRQAVGYVAVSCKKHLRLIVRHVETDKITDILVGYTELEIRRAFSHIRWTNQHQRGGYFIGNCLKMAKGFAIELIFPRAPEVGAQVCWVAVAVIERPNLEPNPNLFQIGDAIDRCRSLLGAVHCRQSQHREEKNDHENGEELYKCKRPGRSF